MVLSWAVCVCVGNSPFSFLGCRNSAFMTLITTLLGCRRSTKMTNTPLFPRNFFLPDREPVFLRFLFRDCYNDLPRSQRFRKSSRMLSLTWPRLLKPPSSPFQNVSTFSSTSCSVSRSETAGWRRISNMKDSKLILHTPLSHQEPRKSAVWLDQKADERRWRGACLWEHLWPSDDLISAKL